jgi:peptidoglycan-associated lipoprotein
MTHSICKALCSVAAATTLSGCFFGNLTLHREIAQAKQQRVEPQVPERQVAEVAPEPPAAPAVEALPVRPPTSVEPTVVTATPTTATTRELPNVILFGSDAYLPDREFDPLLQAHAEQLRADPRRRLLLKGHGDASGGTRYRRALATKRAETIAKALREYGVDEAQLEIVAMADGGAGDASNTRRVELIYR